jgi:hypothetical protein
MNQLSFTHTHSYAGSDAGITVPAVLRSGQRSVDLVASLDTVRLFVYLSGYVAELGLELTRGTSTRFRTANSNFDAFGHEVQVEVLGIVEHSLV